LKYFSAHFYSSLFYTLFVRNTHCPKFCLVLFVAPLNYILSLLIFQFIVTHTKTTLKFVISDRKKTKFILWWNYCKKIIFCQGIIAYNLPTPTESWKHKTKYIQLSQQQETWRGRKETQSLTIFYSESLFIYLVHVRLEFITYNQQHLRLILTQFCTYDWRSSNKKHLVCSHSIWFVAGFCFFSRFYFVSTLVEL